jgi:hypothetical protein
MIMIILKKEYLKIGILYVLINIDDDPKIGIRTPEQDKIHRENMIKILFDRGAKEK